MKTQMLVFALLAVTLLGFASSVLPTRLLAQENDSITAIPAPVGE